MNIFRFLLKPQNCTDGPAAFTSLQLASPLSLVFVLVCFSFSVLLQTRDVQP